MLPHVIRLLWNPVRFAQGTEAAVESLLVKFRAMRNDRPFDALVEDAFKAFDDIFFSFLVYIAGFLAEWRIRRILRGTEAEALKMFLVMDVPSNPTSAMGHAMLALAQSPDMRATDDAAEFEAKIAARSYSAQFMADFDAYIERYGARGFREIDVATPRVMERLGDFFQQLKAINLDDNQMLRVRERKAEAIAKMREVAKSKGKLKAFDKHLRTIEVTYGHRETPKYLVVMMNGALRRVALEIGAAFVAQGRLDAPEDIFELTIAQRHAGAERPFAGAAPADRGQPRTDGDRRWREETIPTISTAAARSSAIRSRRGPAIWMAWRSRTASTRAAPKC